jgi:hypothetical protein
MVRVEHPNRRAACEGATSARATESNLISAVRWMKRGSLEKIKLSSLGSHFRIIYAIISGRPYTVNNYRWAIILKPLREVNRSSSPDLLEKLPAFPDLSMRNCMGQANQTRLKYRTIIPTGSYEVDLHRCPGIRTLTRWFTVSLSFTPRNCRAMIHP